VKDFEKLKLDNLKNLLALKNVNHFEVEDLLDMKNLKASVKSILEDEHLKSVKQSHKVVFTMTIFRASISKYQVNEL